MASLNRHITKSEEATIRHVGVYFRCKCHRYNQWIEDKIEKWTVLIFYSTYVAIMRIFIGCKKGKNILTLMPG
jgi:hypothetical protein